MFHAFHRGKRQPYETFRHVLIKPSPHFVLNKTQLFIFLRLA